MDADQTEKYKMEEDKKIRAYISGSITGNKNAYKHFADAEKELAGFDFIPVNPFNDPCNRNDASDYSSNLIKGMKVLSECDLIYMLKGWQTSTGARIEYSFAVNMGKEVLFESVVENERMSRIRDAKVIDAIGNAIREVMNIPFDVLANAHDRTGFFGRMVFAHHAYIEGGMSTRQIAQFVNRDEATIRYCLKKYDVEYNYNKIFRQMANRVADIIRDLPIPEELIEKRLKKHYKKRKQWKKEKN